MCVSLCVSRKATLTRADAEQTHCCTLCVLVTVMLINEPLLVSTKNGAIVKQHLRRNDPVGCAPPSDLQRRHDQDPRNIHCGVIQRHLRLGPVRHNLTEVTPSRSVRRIAFARHAGNHWKIVKRPSETDGAEMMRDDAIEGEPAISDQRAESSSMNVTTGRPANSSGHAIFAINTRRGSALPTTCPSPKESRTAGGTSDPKWRPILPASLTRTAPTDALTMPPWPSSHAPSVYKRTGLGNVDGTTRSWVSCSASTKKRNARNASDKSFRVRLRPSATTPSTCKAAAPHLPNTWLRVNCSVPLNVVAKFSVKSVGPKISETLSQRS